MYEASYTDPIEVTIDGFIVYVDEEGYGSGSFRFRIEYEGIRYEGLSDLYDLGIWNISGFRKYLTVADEIQIYRGDEIFEIWLPHPFAYGAEDDKRITLQSTDE